MTSFRAARTLAGLALTVPLAALLAALLAQEPTQAATRTVTVGNDFFTPKTLKVAVGDSVKWSFEGTHTSTSSQGFWSSGTKNAGQSYTRPFADSGTYPYYCTIHGKMMNGSIQVPVRATGSASAGYTLRWSARSSTPSSVRYDVQYRLVGSSTWTSWRTATASRSGGFNPSGTHSYYVHARTHVGTHTSSWSPSITVKVT
jgi:plastocyanin